MNLLLLTGKVKDTCMSQISDALPCLNSVSDFGPESRCNTFKFVLAAKCIRSIVVIILYLVCTSCRVNGLKMGMHKRIHTCNV